MSRKLHVILALAAGLLGGLLSRYLAPTPVFAQAQAPVPKHVDGELQNWPKAIWSNVE
jgi:hypothetical protein